MANYFMIWHTGIIFIDTLSRFYYCSEVLTNVRVLLISQFVTNQICSHVTDLPSFVSLAFLYNPADFLPDYLFHLQCYIWAECFKRFYDTDDVHFWQLWIVLFKAFPVPEAVRQRRYFCADPPVGNTQILSICMFSYQQMESASTEVRIQGSDPMRYE